MFRWWFNVPAMVPYSVASILPPEPASPKCFAKNIELRCASCCSLALGRAAHGVKWACWVNERWRLDYHHHRIQSSLDYQTPAPYTVGCVLPALATPQPPEHSSFTNPDALTQAGARTGVITPSKGQVGDTIDRRASSNFHDRLR